MASRREPPRPSDHSPQCPAYSPSAKYSSCTCGLTTPKQRLSLAEAVDAASVSTPAAPRAVADVPSGVHSTSCAERRQRQITLGVEEPVCTCGWQPQAVGALFAQQRIAKRSVEAMSAATLSPIAERIDGSDAIAKLLNDVERQVQQLLGRRIALTYAGTSIIIEQRCLCCGSDIPRKLANEIQLGADLTAETVRMLGVVGAAARQAYLLHRCEPVEQQTAGLSAAELEQLAQELERDGTRLVQRHIEIAKLAAERGR